MDDDEFDRSINSRAPSDGDDYAARRNKHVDYTVDADGDDSADDNRPLVATANGHNGNIAKYEDDSDDDSDDNVPLVNQLQRRAPLPPTSSEGDDEDSDDDIPLVRVVTRTPRPPAKKRVSKTMSAKPAKPRKPKATKAKMEPIEANAKAKKTAKKRAAPVTKKEAKKESTPKKRTKKEEDTPAAKFEMPGQRRETPPDNDPSRLFYQSMYKEKLSLGKKSTVAEAWMLRHGLLDKKLATKLASK